MATQIKEATALVPHNVTALPAAGDMYTSSAVFEHMQRLGAMFAKSALVPAHLQNKVADCTIALDIALRLKESPVQVMQNIYFVSGRAGWKTEYMIARANKAGVFRTRISWRTLGTGKDMAVTAFATLAENGQEVSSTVSMGMAETEGWTKNAKYRSMPEHMLRWRSATMLIRLYCPEVMLGMPTDDELRDITPVEVRPAQSAAERVAAALATPVEIDPETGEIAGEAPYQPAEQSTNDLTGSAEAVSPTAPQQQDGAPLAVEAPEQAPPPAKFEWIAANGRTVPFNDLALMVKTVVGGVAKATPEQAKAARERNKGALDAMVLAGHSEAAMQIVAALDEREKA